MWLVVLAAVVLFLGGPLDMATAKQKLTPEQRAGRLWAKVGPSYGGGPMPEIRFGKVPAPGNAFAITELPPGGEPIIHVGRPLTRALRNRRHLRRPARHALLTEFGRTIQGDRPDPWLIHKTNKVSRRLNKKQQANRRYLARKRP